MAANLAHWFLLLQEIDFVADEWIPTQVLGFICYDPNNGHNGRNGMYFFFGSIIYNLANKWYDKLHIKVAREDNWLMSNE